MPINQIEVSIPFGIGKVSWEPNNAEKVAAWKLYIEYSTRITRVRRRDNSGRDFGSARLAMNSLYKLMKSTRKVLKNADPSIAVGENSLGPITIRVLNNSVRKILDRFHTKLEAHESYRMPNEERVVHERKWKLYRSFWCAMIALQHGIDEYCRILEVIADIAPMKTKFNDDGDGYYI